VSLSARACTRSLQAIWSALPLNALFIKVRDEGRVVNKALYIAVGVNLEGRKELLGLWLGKCEDAKFYLQLPKLFKRLPDSPPL
jgi:putative transposase